jgi:hypothetical protein
MRLTLVIVMVIFTAVLTYAKLLSMASEPAEPLQWHNDGHWPASVIHVPAAGTFSH